MKKILFFVGFIIVLALGYFMIQMYSFARGVVEDTKNGLHTNSYEILEIQPIETEIRYYKCNYSEIDSLTIVLSSGENSKNPTEIWAINSRETEKLTTERIEKVDIRKIITHAKVHISKRFKLKNLTFSEIKFINISDYDVANLIAIVSYEYNEKGNIQKAPVLLDGTIVLSNNE